MDRAPQCQVAGDRQRGDLTAPVQICKGIGLVGEVQIQDRDLPWSPLQRLFDTPDDDFENCQAERVEEEDGVHVVRDLEHHRVGVGQFDVSATSAAPHAGQVFFCGGEHPGVNIETNDPTKRMRGGDGKHSAFAASVIEKHDVAVPGADQSQASFDHAVVGRFVVIAQCPQIKRLWLPSLNPEPGVTQAFATVKPGDRESSQQTVRPDTAPNVIHQPEQQRSPAPLQKYCWPKCVGNGVMINRNPHATPRVCRFQIAVSGRTLKSRDRILNYPSHADVLDRCFADGRAARSKRRFDLGMLEIIN